jgi:ABC-2 type transport system ATP-binding protein
VLLATGLRKRYGEVTALDGVDLTVAPGEIVGFLGPNGAGKTTTMRAIMRLVGLDAGTVTWNGRPVDDRIRTGFGYMPAERGMYPRMRVRDHLVYYGRLSGQPAARTCRAATSSGCSWPSLCSPTPNSWSSTNRSRASIPWRSTL